MEYFQLSNDFQITFNFPNWSLVFVQFSDDLPPKNHPKQSFSFLSQKPNCILLFPYFPLLFHAISLLFSYFVPIMSLVKFPTYGQMQLQWWENSGNSSKEEKESEERRSRRAKR